MVKSSAIIDYLIIICLYIASVVSFNDQLNFLALYVIIPFACFLTILRYQLRTGYSFKWLILLYVWILFTCLFAEYLDLAFRQLKQIIGCVILSYIMTQNARKTHMIPWLYGVYILMFISSVYYALTNILDTAYDIGTDRLDDDKLNANTLAYYLLYTIFSVYILADIIKGKWLSRILKIIFWLMLPVAFFVAIFTASRQVILTSIPLILMLFYVRYIKGVRRRNLLLPVVILLLAGSFIFPKFIEIYDNSYLKERNELDLSDDSRMLLLKDAIKVGFQHPIVGVGPGNYIQYSYNKHISHCSYTELFANSGFLALLLYIGLIYTFMRRQLIRYRRSRDSLFLSLIVFGVIYVVDNVFFVFYNSLWLISFFVLVSAHSDTYYKICHIES